MSFACLCLACGFDPYTVRLDDGFDPDLSLGQNVDLYVTARVNEDYPGAAVLVMHDDVVELDEAYGLLRLDASEPATTTTPFYLAEASMAFTATAVLLLNQQGRLDLHARVVDLLPGMPDPWRNITVHHLLTHQSGLRDYLTQLELARPGLTNEEVLEALRGEGLQGPAGGNLRFSHSGYVLLAEIVESVAGQSFSRFVQENIFDPLGMDHSYVVDESSPPVPGRAIGYGTLETVSDYELATVGDGGVYSSLRDMATWLRSIEDNSLLSSESTGQMLTDHGHEGYGYGWFIGHLAGRSSYYHEGEHPGFRVFVGVVPESDMTIVILTSGAYPWPSQLPGVIMAHVLGV